MRAVIQRVTSGSVSVGNEVVGEIEHGLVVLLGVAQRDNTEDAIYLADKIVNLRIFEDENKKMNRSLLETGGEMLVISQFTLLGDCKKGRRPSFIQAAKPDYANELYNQFIDVIRQNGVSVKTGRFQAVMPFSSRRCETRLGCVN
jgi:D-tyrosyl-tRNA(Tyr) deacylase